MDMNHRWSCPTDLAIQGKSILELAMCSTLSSWKQCDLIVIKSQSFSASVVLMYHQLWVSQTCHKAWSLGLSSGEWDEGGSHFGTAPPGNGGEPKITLPIWLDDVSYFHWHGNMSLTISRSEVEDLSAAQRSELTCWAHFPQCCVRHGLDDTNPEQVDPIPTQDKYWKRCKGAYLINYLTNYKPYNQFLKTID